MDLSATLNSIISLSKKHDRVILFHSGAGKDSIALLNMMAPHFKEIVCVYMFMVKDLEHINRYIHWAEKKYPNCRFIQTPHYAHYNNKKHGAFEVYIFGAIIYLPKKCPEVALGAKVRVLDEEGKMRFEGDNRLWKKEKYHARLWV